MREIKFRAWNSIDKKMVGWCSLKHSFDAFIKSKHYELMQFTGLTDKNGVDIYEGDIVQGHFYDTDEWKDIAGITYCDHRAKFVFNDGNGEQDAFIDDINTGTLEVIGNIHQNPELLENKSEN